MWAYNRDSLRRSPTDGATALFLVVSIVNDIVRCISKAKLISKCRAGFHFAEINTEVQLQGCSVHAYFIL